MQADPKQERLKQLPSMTGLLKSRQVNEWLAAHPLVLVTECLREGLAEARQTLLNGDAGTPLAASEAVVLRFALARLEKASSPMLRSAINATGIILHTGLGRAVFSEAVVESVSADLKGFTTLAVDRETGERLERDELIEPLLTELTGAEAATVVNNNAAATMLVLAALAADREVIVSRGQLIEIGGSFRLPEVMHQSRARLVEVGATNRTHLKDYKQAITPQTAAILRVHPSNYRIVGFTSEPALGELAEVAHQHQLLLIDDLGAGALLDLRQFGLPHEPTVRESIAAGADVVLFSGDKLIGGSQAGIIVGRKTLIERLRKHPLMRAVRADKTCLMILERTLQLFRDPERLRRENPTYAMLGTPMETLKERARRLVEELGKCAPSLDLRTGESDAFLGSGSLPTERIPSFAVTLTAPGQSVTELAKRLRLDAACVFGRIESDRLVLDMRTITEAQVPMIAAALARACFGEVSPDRSSGDEPSPPR